MGFRREQFVISIFFEFVKTYSFWFHNTHYMLLVNFNKLAQLGNGSHIKCSVLATEELNLTHKSVAALEGLFHNRHWPLVSR